MWKKTRLAALLAVASLAGLQAKAEEAWGPSYFTNLEVVDQDGHKLRFYDDVLKDRQVVVSFIYTTCKELCPISTARLVTVKDVLRERFGKHVTFVSLSVDPENDTPEKLKAYAEAFGTGDGWLLLTGKPENLKTIAARLGNREDKKEQHRNEVVLGNASTGDWSRNSAFIEPERLAFDILQLDPDWQDTKRDTSQDNNYNTVATMPDHPGEGLFRKLCSSCHTIGVGTRVGPDLRDVHERRNEDWLVSFITRPDKMLAEKDPVAVALNKQFPVAVMPSLGLTETDARDVMAYLKSKSLAMYEGQEIAGNGKHDHSTHKHDSDN
jgi:cytochrome oxidase Cu insertion factor (SCO1/SenC/PrrC family)